MKESIIRLVKDSLKAKLTEIEDIGGLTPERAALLSQTLKIPKLEPAQENIAFMLLDKALRDACVEGKIDCDGNGVTLTLMERASRRITWKSLINTMDCIQDYWFSRRHKIGKSGKNIYMRENSEINAYADLAILNSLLEYHEHPEKAEVKRRDNVWYVKIPEGAFGALKAAEYQKERGVTR